jgi:hypothetical protein
MKIGQSNSLSSITHSAWIHLLQGLFHFWKYLSNYVIGLCKSFCVVLGWVVSTSLDLLTFSAFLIQGECYSVFRETVIWCYILDKIKRLQTRDGPSALLSAAGGQTIVDTHPSFSNR